MSAKSVNFLVQPPQNDGPENVFAQSNGNHPLMANTFKLDDYQTFGLMKNHKKRKI